MKKSIKYAGIAAATLLAVAPVAAPALSTVTTTQAAATDAQNTAVANAQADVATKTLALQAAQKAVAAGSAATAEQQQAIDAAQTALDQANATLAKAQKAVNDANAADEDTDGVNDTDANTLKQDLDDFKGQFSDIDSTPAMITAIGQNQYFGTANAGKINDVQKDANVVAMMKSALSNKTFDKLTAQDATVYFTASDAKGKSYNGISVGQKSTDVAKAMGLDSRMPMTIQVHIKYNALNSSEGTYETVKSFDINKTSDNELTSINATFTTPVNVAKNSKVLATQLVNTDSVALSDQDGNSTAVSNIQFGNAYYYTYAAAMDAAKATNFDPENETGNVKSSDIDGDEFKTAGTYYQTVTYTAADGSALASMLKAYQTDPTGYTVYVNGKEASKGYDFNSAATTDGTTETITFVRAIKVSNNESEWTVTDNKGVVTTKATTPYYTLVNDEGDKITNRALAKNTAWITDQKRVDQDGNTQYRVATGEWIDANDVTFSDKATTDEGEYTDVQALNGKVTLDGPASFVYFLYNNNGTQIANRALTGDSAWFTDKKATNAAGVTVYHVATGEWVQAGSGVNYLPY